MFKISLRIGLYFVCSGYLYSHLRKIFEYQNHVVYYYIKEGFKKMWNSEMWLNLGWGGDLVFGKYFSDQNCIEFLNMTC